MRRIHGLVLIAATSGMMGCSITQTVDPVRQAQISQICILDNKDILMDGFQPEVQKQIEAKRIPAKVYIGPRPADCSHYLEYTANWQWDMAMYLTYAEFRVYDPSGLAGKAVYNARNGSGRLDKFGATAEKIRPLIDQLFGAVTAGPVVVPVQPQSTAASRTPDRSARLQELQRLHDQGLITDEEFATKRQAILGEI